MPLPFHSLENPFEKPRKRNPDDAELVGKILGPEEERAMREALGEVGPPKKGPEEDWGDLQMSEEERKRLEKIEQRESPEVVRQRFIAWAEEFNLGDEDWVNKVFTFHPDGSVTVRVDLNLESKDITYLPKGLRRVGVDVYLNHNQLTSLEGMPREIGGDLYLYSNQLTSLEGLPEKIGGGLYLQNNPATEIPGGSYIGGGIYIHKTQTALAEDIEKKYPGKLSFSP